MALNDAHIALVHDASAPVELLENAREALRAPSLDLRVERQPPLGVLAASEWLLPTALVVFIGQGYFNGFLSEAGKDHYALLKQVLKGLASRTAGLRRRIALRRSARAGGRTFSTEFSIHAETAQGQRIRFLFVPEDGASSDAAVEAVANLLLGIHAGALTPALRDLLERQPIYGGTLVLAFNPENERLERVHPMTGDLYSP